MSNSSFNATEAVPQASGMSFDCSKPLENIQPDPDVAGIGVSARTSHPISGVSSLLQFQW